MKRSDGGGGGGVRGSKSPYLGRIKGHSSILKVGKQLQSKVTVVYILSTKSVDTCLLACTCHPSAGLSQ